MMTAQIISAPEGVVSTRVAHGQRLGFAFDLRTEAAAFERDGVSLIVTLKDGSKVILENFFVDIRGGALDSLPVLVFPDGSEAASADFLHSVNPEMDVTPVVLSTGSSMPDPVFSSFSGYAALSAGNRTGIAGEDGGSMSFPPYPDPFSTGDMRDSLLSFFTERGVGIHNGGVGIHNGGGADIESGGGNAGGGADIESGGGNAILRASWSDKDNLIADAAGISGVRCLTLDADSDNGDSLTLQAGEFAKVAGAGGIAENELIINGGIGCDAITVVDVVSAASGRKVSIFGGADGDMGDAII
ncbi:MAG: hypothetical protein LBB52_04655, partial [Desulfovibrio sp.]|nr:hypothetical protein [Desulfovibrio sp.]